MAKASPPSSLLLSLWCGAAFCSALQGLFPRGRGSFPEGFFPKKTTRGELFRQGRQEDEREAVPWGWVFAEEAAGERVPAGAGCMVRGAAVWVQHPGGAEGLPATSACGAPA